MPIGIDRWAYDLANEVAAQTGWRASDVYAYVVLVKSEDADEGTVLKVMETMAECRIHGEPFSETVARVSEAARQLVEEEPNGQA